MRLLNVLIRRPARPRPLATGCADCAAGLDHCHHTLVLHADGRAECEGDHRCDADEARHHLWVPCTELGCACTGEEHGLDLAA